MDPGAGAPRQFDPALQRYSRQMLYEPFGERSQKMLRHSRIAIVGCGALGSVLASTLVRAGVGATRIIDRDFVEIDNLQRQVLFDEGDVAARLPKAEAAVRKLHKINSSVEVEAVVADLNHRNAETLLADAEVLLDGADNFETRFLINDVAVKHNIPWVYGACVGAEGLVLPILPRSTPCLRCIWEEAPPPGMSPTCDTAGVLSSVVNVVASLQALEAMKILAGKLDEVSRQLLTLDVWQGRFRGMQMQEARGGNCPCCQQGRYEFLDGGRASGATTLCGRNAVQIAPCEGAPPADFRLLAERLRRFHVAYNEFLLRANIEEVVVTVFADGRAIIQGVSDASAARAIYAKYVGA